MGTFFVGTGIFAGAVGTAIFDQSLTDSTLYDNTWLVTLYEYWDHPYVGVNNATQWFWN